MASEIPPLKVQIEADTAPLKAGLDKAEASLKGLKTSTSKANEGFDVLDKGMQKLKLAGIAAAAAIGALAVKMAVDAVKGAIEEQAAQDRLANTLKNLTGLTHAQSMAIDAQLEKMALASGVADDDLRPAYQRLVTATKDTSEAQRLLKIAMDVSAATGKPLETVTASLSRAYAGNETALARLGIGMGAAEIKALGLDGTIDKMAKTFEGASEKQANTLEFRIKRLKMAFGEMAEDIATAVLPIIEKLMAFITSTVTPLFNALRDALAADKGGLNSKFQEIGEYIAKFVKPVFEALQGAFNRVRAAINDNRENIKKYLATMGEMFAWINKYIIPLFRTYLVNVISNAGKVISVALRAILPVVQFVADGVKSLINGVVTVINGFIRVYNKVNVLFGKKDIPLLTKIGEQAGQATTNLKSLGKAADEAKGKVADVFAAGAGGGGGATAPDAKAKAALDKLRDQMEKSYAEIDKVQRDARDKQRAAEKDHEERSLEILEKYNEAKANAHAKHAEQLRDADEAYAEAKANAEETRQKSDAEARKRHADKLIEIAANQAEREKELFAEYRAKIVSLEQSFLDKENDAREKASAKKLDIVKQSIDRLRDAFLKGTEFDIGDAFDTAQTADAMIVDLKGKLGAAKELQNNAAMLAGLGYSQVFIEQVVSKGPEAGNAIAKALRDASPEATKELQALYKEIEAVSQTGLDNLASTLNAGGNLATYELRAAYNQVAVDLAKDLAILNADLREAVALADKEYQDGLAKAKSTRKAEEAESFKDLSDALAASESAFKDAIADADETLTKAKAKAKEDLEKGLAEAKLAYDKAIKDSQDALEKAISEAQTSMLKKLAELRADIAKTATEMAAIGATPATVYTPSPQVSDTSLILQSKTEEQKQEMATNAAVAAVGSTNVVINGFDLSDPNATAQSMVSLIKYGQTVTVLTNKEDLVTTGIAAFQKGYRREAE